MCYRAIDRCHTIFMSHLTIFSHIFDCFDVDYGERRFLFIYLHNFSLLLP